MNNDKNMWGNVGNYNLNSTFSLSSFRFFAWSLIFQGPSHSRDTMVRLSHSTNTVTAYRKKQSSKWSPCVTSSETVAKSNNKSLALLIYNMIKAYIIRGYS